MKRKLIILSIFFTCIPVILAVCRIHEYYHYLTIEKEKLEDVRKHIAQIDMNIDSEEKKKDEILTNQDEEIKLLELWKKRLENLEKKL